MYGHESWGRYPKVSQQVIELDWLPKNMPSVQNSILAFGLGRSYGDSCLNNGASVLGTRLLNHIISFDTNLGIIEAESGITLKELLSLCVPKGWFLPVTPGTQYVTLGGAVANDVHGKNHHKAGTFGQFVKEFVLLRSNGERLVCSVESNPELFRATIAGLGLTGLILSVKFQLIPIESALVESENISFGSLQEFSDISQASTQSFDYTVAWLDCVSSGENFGRGIFMRGNHAHGNMSANVRSSKTFPCPFDFPSITLNQYTVKAFNNLYYYMQKSKNGKFFQHYQPFFYPLDAVNNWNRIYGRQGFLQLQFVIPFSAGIAKLSNILNKIVKSGQASFLAVLKEFGDIKSPGLLSFPRPGLTLCLDFAMRGQKTTELFKTIEQEVLALGGAIYPAKDACMSSDSFKEAFPNYSEFLKYKDPKFSSSFWRRVME